MLSVRAATVVLADQRQSFLSFNNAGLPTEIGVLANILEEELKVDLDEHDDTVTDNEGCDETKQTKGLTTTGKDLAPEESGLGLAPLTKGG